MMKLDQTSPDWSHIKNANIFKMRSMPFQVQSRISQEWIGVWASVLLLSVTVALGGGRLASRLGINPGQDRAALAIGSHVKTSFFAANIFLTTDHIQKWFIIWKPWLSCIENWINFVTIKVRVRSRLDNVWPCHTYWKWYKTMTFQTTRIPNH